mmetsp:Transcript_10224/g.18644  ORF Transcript_10224/g.18644 Transcript_10224/m.18644 type:complete len:407 (+) Transcript_10224:140-1360(+)|eukprot:CAMPEP_0178739048 /NCGR_PEP_ID=MMETSP0744-20121128/3844_1 /TAXON_ID=913974 /ORGANISM="Nitzschia punctata, Strain CCMP561" /LENGTH=406 /DNA_ID=CAMNT_0020391719 /DNA_START=226 /DNA_END=1446 /DNA_ORIENTATION=-
MDEGLDYQNEALFDTSVLDSLNKLTDELNEDLLTDGSDSVAASDSYDSDDYSMDDDEDPDSGENKLFSMMDDLVMELQMEIEDTGDEIEEKDDPVPELEEENNPVVATEGRSEVLSPKSDTNENSESVSNGGSSQSILNKLSPADRSNNLNLNNISASERAEKVHRLHLHVKSLLRRVADMAQENQVAPTVAEGDSTPVSLTLQGEDAKGMAGRPRGDSSADRLERLLGAIATYSSSPGRGGTPLTERARTNGDEGPVVNDGTDEENRNKTVRAMSSYTQRKRREYLLRKQASNEEGQGSKEGARTVKALSVNPPPPPPKTVGSPLSSTQHSRKTPNKKKRKQRTNKHKKRKPRLATPNVGQQRQQQQQPGLKDDSMSKQSLQSLLASLLALDDRLSREQLIQSVR